MSRIGKQPISIPDKVQVDVKLPMVEVKGPKGQVKVRIPSGVELQTEGKVIVVKKNPHRAPGQKRNQNSANYGLTRTLLANAVKGVTEGFQKVLELHGVGYRAAVSGRNLEISLGFSHPVKFEIPPGIEIKVDKQTVISVIGADKELVGRTAAKIRSFRPPEPYLGKGVRYQNENLRRKVGKSGGK